MHKKIFLLIIAALFSSGILCAKKPSSEEMESIIYLMESQYLLEFGSSRNIYELKNFETHLIKIYPSKDIKEAIYQVLLLNLALRKGVISPNLPQEIFDICPACEGIKTSNLHKCELCRDKHGFVLNPDRARAAYDKHSKFLQEFLQQEQKLHEKSGKIKQPDKAEILAHLNINLRPFKIGHDISDADMSVFRKYCLMLRPDEEIKTAVNDLEAINLKFNKSEVSNDELPTDAFVEGICRSCKGSGRTMYSLCNGDWGYASCFTCGGRGRTIVNPAFNSSIAKKAYAKRMEIIENWLNAIENNDESTDNQNVNAADLFDEFRNIQNGNQISVETFTAFRKKFQQLSPPDEIKDALKTMESINKKLNNQSVPAKELPSDAYNVDCRICKGTGITFAKSCYACDGLGRPESAKYNTTKALKAYRVRSKIVEEWLESQIQ